MYNNCRINLNQSIGHKIGITETDFLPNYDDYETSRDGQHKCEQKCIESKFIQNKYVQPL